MDTSFANRKTAVPGGVSLENRGVGPILLQHARAHQAIEPSDQITRNWVAKADVNYGKRIDVLTSPEREELLKLRRENRQLKLDHDILTKGTAWFVREADTSPKRSHGP